MSKVDMLHDRGKINDFMFGILSKSRDAMDVELWTEAVQDAVEATMAGVTNERDYQVFHYIDIFVEDLAEEVFGAHLSGADEAALKLYMFELREEIDYANLVSFWVAIVKWLESRKNGVAKEAYPNRGSNGARYVKQQQNGIWAKLANEVRKMITKGVQELDALNQASGVLHPRERPDFVAWYRFKFGKMTQLYDVNRIIRDLGEGKMKTRKSKTSKFAGIHEQEGRYYLPDFNAPFMAADKPEKSEPDPDDLIDKEEHRVNFQEARSKLVSRTFAIDKLLERYHDIVGQEAIGDIEDALNVLRKKIRALKCATIIRDTVIKTATIVKKKGFVVGAYELETLAYDFTNQENPRLVKKAFTGANTAEISPLVTELQTLSNQLKRRDLVREIAKIDFKLHGMNAAALFPELGEAQAKLIDATTYASNKLEDVIPKLRSVTQQGEVAPEAAAPAEAPPLALKKERAPEAPKLAPVKAPAPAAAPAPAGAPAPAPAAPVEPPKPKGIAEFEKAI